MTRILSKDISEYHLSCNQIKTMKRIQCYWIFKMAMIKHYYKWEKYEDKMWWKLYSKLLSLIGEYNQPIEICLATKYNECYYEL